jgi:hypothetical protein
MELQFAMIPVRIPSRILRSMNSKRKSWVLSFAISFLKKVLQVGHHLSYLP